MCTTKNITSNCSNDQTTKLLNGVSSLSTHYLSSSETQGNQHNTEILVIVDPGISEVEFILKGIIPQAQTLLLNASEDGVKQITQALKYYNSVSSLHIISHGSPGRLNLGNTDLSLETLQQYTQQLQSWFNPSSSTQTGTQKRNSILLYGCHVAAGDAGTELIEKLHHLTGAEIAASAQLMGSSKLGGNWQLEVTTNDFKAELALTPELQENYSEVFAEPITGFTISSTPNTPQTFTFLQDNPQQNSVAFTFGLGNTLIVEEFEIGNGALTFQRSNFLTDFEIRRADNNVVTGERQLVWFDSNNGSATQFNPQFPENISFSEIMENFLSGLSINAGTDNIFANSGNAANNNNNIERVDYLNTEFPLFTPSNPDDSGFLVVERSRLNDNNQIVGERFKIAAITDVDGNGNPTAFGRLFRVVENDWGASNETVRPVVMRQDGTVDTTEINLTRTTQALNPQSISGVYVSLENLGLQPGEQLYGYALFADDVPLNSTSEQLLDVENQAIFPRNTNDGDGGLDLIEGGYLYSADTPPTLDLDGDNSTTTGSNVDIDLNTGYITAFSGPAVPIADTDIVIEDADSQVISNAVITLLDPIPAESLSVNGTLPAGITASDYNPETGRLILQGTATIDQYQTAIRQIRYNNSTPDPEPTQRRVTVEVADGFNASNLAETVINIVEVPNNPPDAVNDAAETTIDDAVNINVLTNDQDLDNDPLSITVVSNPTSGTATINDNGTPNNPADDFVVYTPTSGFVGNDSFTYTITDGEATDTATVNITVIDDRNLPPIAENDQRTTPPDTAIDIDVLTNDSDPDNSPNLLSITDFLAASLRGGTVALNAAGTGLIYTPPTGYIGNDSFTYTITDGEETDTATVIVSVIDSIPVAENDERNTVPGQAVTINVLANDSDPDNGPLPLSITNFDLISNRGGLVSFNPSGTALIYTPVPTFVGVDTFTYTITDGENTASATVTINVAEATPDAVNDEKTTAANTAVTVDVLDNDTDPENDPLSIVNFDETSANGGTVAFNANETALVYTPLPGFIGTDTFTYTITDGVETDTATVTVNVVGTAPVAVDDEQATAPGQAVTVDVLDNDSDPDNNPEPLSIEDFDVTSANLGTVALSPDGTALVYTPAAGFTGVDNFSYTITDGIQISTATVTVNVSQGFPNAANDLDTTAANTAVTVDVLDNDSDPDNGPNPLSIINFDETSANSGTVSFNDDGTALVYTPALDFVGVDTFTYTINDGVSSDTATVTINVTAGVPNGVDDGENTAADTPITVNVLDNDTDPENDPLSIDSFDPTSANGGTITLSTDGVGLIYTPAAGFIGTDTFTYTVTDGVETDTATVTINVTEGTPNAVDDERTTVVGTAITVNVLENDTDPEDDPLNIDDFDNTSANGGTVTLSEDGSALVYTPAPGFVGTDTFTYVVTDGTRTNTATVTINVEDKNPNAIDDKETTGFETPVTINPLENDIDPDNDVVTISSFDNSSANGGTITLNPDGVTFNYTPPAGFSGNDTFTYTITDGIDSDTATVTVTVNTPPTATDDTGTTEPDTPVTIDVLDNDTDADGNPLIIDSFEETTDNGGTVTLDPNGGLIYTPAPGFTGTDTFDYVVTDGTDTETGTVTVTVTVDPPNSSPVGGEDNTTTPVNSPVNIDVLNNDTDAEGNPLSITDVSTPGNGTVTIDDNGTPNDGSDDFVVYTPNSGFTGEDTFTYTVTDSEGNSDTVTVTVDVTEASPNPNPEPSPSPNPSPNPNPEPSPSPNPNPEPSPSPNPNPEPSPSPNPNPEPSPSPNPNPEPSPEPNPNPEPSPEPSPNPEPSPSPNPNPEPSPEPNPNPEPSPEPNPEEPENPSIPRGETPDEDACACPPIPEFEGMELPQRVEIDVNLPPDAIPRSDGDDSDDVLKATSEIRSLRGALGNDTLEGSDGDDSLYGGVDDDTSSRDLLGGLANNILIRDISGSDAIDGAGGNDFISANESNDTVLGNDGNDTAYGGQDHDLMFGDDGNDVLYGDMGNDTVIGGNGKNGAISRDEDQNKIEDDDTLYGYRDQDVMVGGPGHDVIFNGKGSDFTFAGQGHDTSWGDLGDDTLYGDEGNDTLYGDTNDPNQQQPEGTDLMWGGSGDDFMVGNRNNDTLSGGTGNDTVRGGRADDLLFGDVGNDFLYGDNGNDMLCGNEGDDTLFGDENTQVGNDSLSGGSGNDLLFGNDGEDKLCGSSDNDTIHGGQAADTLKGGSGNDWLFGDEGNDLIITGSGEDRIVLFSMENSTDTITDFSVGEDLILLSGGLSFNNLSFTQSGTSTLITANGQELAILQEITLDALNDANNFATF